MIVERECPNCNGGGAVWSMRCCGRGTERGDCCGNPEPDPEPCPQCGGSGRIEEEESDQ